MIKNTSLLLITIACLGSHKSMIQWYLWKVFTYSDYQPGNRLLWVIKRVNYIVETNYKLNFLRLPNFGWLSFYFPIENIRQLSAMLHGNGSGYLEAEAYGNAETGFLKKLVSGYVLEAYPYIYICKTKN